MKAAKYDSTGKRSGEIELADEIFSGEQNKALMYEIVRAELHNRRQGTHKTKTFSEVSGGGRKPYKQKGTGNARQGSIRAPQYRGGATVFGPKPRDYEIKMPIKKRRAGIRSILVAKAMAGNIALIDSIDSGEFKTKMFFQAFKNVGLGSGIKTIAYIVDSEEETLKKSVANIAGVELIQAKRITAPELYYAQQVIISESALPALVEIYKKETGKNRVGAA